MRYVIAHISDLHAPSTVGTHVMNFKKADGSGHADSIFEQWMYQCYIDFYRAVQNVVSDGDNLLTVFNGDLAESNHKFPTYRLVSFDPADLLEITLQTIQPFVEISDNTFIVAGTEQHAGVDGSLETMVARAIGAETVPVDQTAVWRILRLDLEGYRIDFAHHGRIGTRPWTRSNAMAGLYMEMLDYYAKRRKIPPDMSIFAHVHTYSDSGNMFPIRIITSPAWQGQAYYTIKQPLRIGDIGGIIIVVEDGKLVSVTEHIYTPEDVRIWVSP